MKLNVDPNIQLDSVLPVAGSLTLLTCAIFTSPAVQFKALLWDVLSAGRPAAELYSFCKQVFGAAWANAGADRTAIANSATANWMNHFEVRLPVNQPARQPRSRGDPTVRLQFIVRISFSLRSFLRAFRICPGHCFFQFRGLSRFLVPKMATPVLRELDGTILLAGTSFPSAAGLCTPSTVNAQRRLQHSHP